MFYVRLLIVISMWLINHSVDWGQFTCDYMLISNRLFNNRHGFFSLCFNIWYFFSRHRLHWFDGFLFVVAWFIIFQVILNFEFLCNFQTYLERSVSFSYFSWLNDLLWLLYLSLNVVLVNPIYATCSFSKDTVALYMLLCI